MVLKYTGDTNSSVLQSLPHYSSSSTLSPTTFSPLISSVGIPRRQFESDSKVGAINNSVQHPDDIILPLACMRLKSLRHDLHIHCLRNPVTQASIFCIYVMPAPTRLFRRQGAGRVSWNKLRCCPQRPHPCMSSLVDTTSTSALYAFVVAKTKIYAGPWTHILTRRLCVSTVEGSTASPSRPLSPCSRT